MAFNNLRDFLSAIEARKELVRVKEKVSPILEITEWSDRSCKRNGPAFLFENVEGSAFPVAINLFGTLDRTALSLGVKHLDEIAKELEELLHQRPPETIIEKLKMLPLLMKLANYPPKKVRSGPCQEVVLTGDKIDLGILPALK